MDNVDWERLLGEDGDEVEDYHQGEPEKQETSRPANLTQHTLLSYVVGNYDVWARVEPIIKPVYFDEEYKPVVKLLLSHSEEYKQVPSITVIRMKTGVLLDEPKDAQDERTAQWILDEIQKFCRYRALIAEIKRASLALQNDENDEVAEQILQNVQAITEIRLQKDLGIEVHRDARALLSEQIEEITKPTMYTHLDRVIGSGFPCPGMVLFAGASGIGKSVALTNFGVNYCQQGDFVVYISLELDQKRIFQRVCSMMMNIPTRGIYTERDKISGGLEYRLETKNDGLFRIKKMSMSGTTSVDINAYLKELYIKEGIKPTVLLLDYLDLLHPRTRVDLGNIHIKDKFAAEETYALCEEWGMLCLTASQMVKNNSELDEFDHAGVAGGTPKINTMDYVLALKRKDGDKEFWMRVLKGRYGGGGARIPFDWDVNTLRISDGTDEQFYAQNPFYNPNYQRDNAVKTGAAMRTEINKEYRRVANDGIMDSFNAMNKDFMDMDSPDPMTGGF